MQDDQTWHGMHGGTCQIVIIAHPEDIRVGELIVKQRVRIGAVAIVCRPRLTVTRHREKVKSKKNM